TEPAICPEYGRQTQTCRDMSSCGNKPIINQIECNPGICSGCLVPKWFNSNAFGDNRCIPYGFRFEHQIGWTFEEQTRTESEILTVDDAHDNGITLSITPDGLVTLKVPDWNNNKTYVFRQGDKVYVDITGWKWNDDIVGLSFVATEVVYNTINYESSYVRFDFIITYLGKVVDTINSYCDIDGYVKPQKSKFGDNDWAKCQNNYECESNLCSYGECIALKDMIQEVSAFKRVIMQFFCRITNLLSNDNYDQCLIDNLA
ncbi:MAG: hypothetical protein ABIH65_02745, partial [Nanoarchaeota archaeon]